MATAPCREFPVGFEERDLATGCYNIVKLTEINKVRRKKVPRSAQEVSEEGVEPQISEGEAFMDLVAQGDLKGVKAVIRKDTEVALYTGLSGDTPLHVAAARGFTKIVKILVQCSELDQPNLGGYTALMLAVMNAEASTARILCEAGSGLRLRAKDGSTPAMLLDKHCKEWDPECLKNWQRPPKPEAPPPSTPQRPPLRKRQRTPAFYREEAEKDPSKRSDDDKMWAAVMEEDTGAMLELLGEGYDPNVVDDEWWDPPLSLNETEASVGARDRFDHEGTEGFEPGTEPPPSPVPPPTAAASAPTAAPAIAAGSGGGDGAAVNGRAANALTRFEPAKRATVYRPATQTPLLVIAIAGAKSSRAADLLLRFGALPDVADFNGVTPLIAASALGMAPLCSHLVEKLASSVVPKLLPTVLDPRYSVALHHDVSGRTALLASSAALQPSCCFALLQGGANPKATDWSGQTALHLCVLGAADAAAHAHRLAAKLKRANASVDVAWAAHVAKLEARNAELEAAAQRASKGKSKLSLFGSKVASSVANAVGAGGPQVVPIPPQRPSLPLAKTAQDAAGAAEAAAKACVEVVDMLVLPSLLGASVPNSKSGATPLHVAARDGVDGVAAHLLQLGASVDAKDRRGRTPLHLACANGRLECARLLCEAGADAKAVAMDLSTPLALAADCCEESEAWEWAEMFQAEVAKRKAAAAKAEAEVKQKRNEEIQAKRRQYQAERERKLQRQQQEHHRRQQLHAFSDHHHNTMVAGGGGGAAGLASSGFGSPPAMPSLTPTTFSSGTRESSFPQSSSSRTSFAGDSSPRLPAIR